MNFSTPFILRPVGTALLALGLLLSGIVAYNFLPDPETMATSIAAPLERHLGEIGGVTELTSTSAVGSTVIVCQFDVDRDIEGAAHDVQAAIIAATADLPSDLPTRPYYRKFNPAEAPILSIALTSDTLSPGQVYDAADTILAQRLSQIDGVSQVQVNGAEKPAVRVRLNPGALRAAADYGGPAGPCPGQYEYGRDALMRSAARERADLLELRRRARPSSHGGSSNSGAGGERPSHAM